MGSGALNKSCFLLIVIAGMERFAYKGVASNLVSYLTDVLKMSNSAAARTVNSWCGFTSMLPLLVAPLVDSYWNRYSTILTSSLLYIVGLLALTSTTLEWPWIPRNVRSSSSVFWSLCMISLGQGGYNPSLQAFGADQIETEDELPCSKNEQNPDKKSLFFQLWYFGVCTGSLLGNSIMAYVQETLGWGVGFAIPTLLMIASTTLFSCGGRFYANKANCVHKKSSFNSIQTIKAAASKLIHCVVPCRNEKKYNVWDVDLEDELLFLPDEDPETISGKKSINNIDLLEISRVVLRLLPIWTTLLMFAVIFQQPPTFFTKQGMNMKRNIGSHFKIPPATLQSAITISIILLMPFYDKFFIPFARFIMQSEKAINTMQRIGIGMFLSIVAMIVAAIVEMKRLKMCKNVGASGEMLSIFWLLPQYILLGISDIFTVVGMQEFFYNEVPAGMKTMGIALYTSVFGVGSFASALLVYVVEKVTSSSGSRKNWFSDDMDEARLDNYYWLLAFASSVSLLIFVILCRCQKTR